MLCALDSKLQAMGLQVHYSRIRVLGFVLCDPVLWLLVVSIGGSILAQYLLCLQTLLCASSFVYWALCSMLMQWTLMFHTCTTCSVFIHHALCSSVRALDYMHAHHTLDYMHPLCSFPYAKYSSLNFKHQPFYYTLIYTWVSSSLFLLKSHFRCLYLPNHFAISRMWHSVNFWSKYSWFEFRVFFLQDQLPY